MRGDYKQSECGKVILPFIVLRRLHCVLEPPKVDARVNVQADGQTTKKTAFYVRVANGTKELGEAEKAKFVSGRWPNT